MAQKTKSAKRSVKKSEAEKREPQKSESQKSESQTRDYDLRKRLENMDQTRIAILQAARQQLEAQGYRQMTMASLAAESGVTRQTIHNLFGPKRGVLEALFDSIALEGGMEGMREVMTQLDPDAMLRAFVQTFCSFWAKNQILFRRIHGIGAIDPDFGELLHARNQRRYAAALQIVKRLKSARNTNEAAKALTALTSFEFYDALAQHGQPSIQPEKLILALASTATRI